MSDQDSNYEEDYATSEYIPIRPRTEDPQSPSQYLADFDEEGYEDYLLNEDHLRQEQAPEEITMEAREELSKQTKAASEGASKKRKGTKTDSELERKTRKGPSPSRASESAEGTNTDGLRSSMRLVKDRLRNSKKLSWGDKGGGSSDLREKITRIQTNRQREPPRQPEIDDEETLSAIQEAIKESSALETRETRSSKRASQKEVASMGGQEGDGEDVAEISDDSGDEEVAETPHKEVRGKESRRGSEQLPRGSLNQVITAKKFRDAIDKITNRLDDMGAIQDEMRCNIEYLMGVASGGVLKENSTAYQLIKPDNPHKMRTMGTVGDLSAFDIPQSFPGLLPGAGTSSKENERNEISSLGASLLDDLRIAKLRLGQSQAAEPASNSDTDEHEDEEGMAVDTGKV